MADVDLRNIMKLPHLFKLLELGIGLSILMLYRIPECSFLPDPVRSTSQHELGLELNTGHTLQGRKGKCRDSPYCGNGNFCNYDFGSSGYCESCGGSNGQMESCEALGLITERGENECMAICKERTTDPVASPLHFAEVVLYGYSFLVFLQVLSIILGDKSPALELMVALFGFTFYLTIGMKIIDFSWRSATGPAMCNALGKALGSLSVICAVVFFLDAIFSGLVLHKCQTCTYRVE